MWFSILYSGIWLSSPSLDPPLTQLTLLSVCVCCCVSGSWSDLNSHISWGSGKPTSFTLSLSLSLSLSICLSFFQPGNPSFFFFPSLILLVALILWLTQKKRANTPSETPRNNCSSAESWVCLRNSISLRGNLELLCWNTDIFPRQTADPSPVSEWSLTQGRCGAGTDAPESLQGTKKVKEVSLSPKTFCGMSLLHWAEG